MDTRKVLLAVVVAYVFLMGSNYAMHALWLLPVYQQHAEVFRPIEQIVPRMWIIWLGQLLFVLMFIYLYARGVEAKPWLLQGLRYGIFMALFVAVPFALNQHVVYRVPYTLAVEWMAAGSLQMVVLGLVAAGFCRKQSSPREPQTGREAFPPAF